MKVTSATLVTIVALLGTLAEALQHSGNPQLAVAGLVLAGLYTVCHSLVAVKANAALSLQSPIPTLEPTSPHLEEGYVRPESSHLADPVVAAPVEAAATPAPATDAPKA